ncbi:hypothetical protein WAI453_010773 [Rhynchosporium graminicola]
MLVRNTYLLISLVVDYIRSLLASLLILSLLVYYYKSYIIISNKKICNDIRLKAVYKQE